MVAFMHSTQTFKDFVFFLMEKGIEVSGSYRNYYNSKIPKETFIWDFHSNAKSQMYVVETLLGISIYGRYDFETHIEYGDDFDDFMYEVLAVFRDNIMMYPSKDFSCPCWFKLMEEYKVI